MKPFPEPIIAIGPRRSAGVAHRFLTLAALFGVALAAVTWTAHPAKAQSGTLGTHNVIVDLSVLGDNGLGPAPLARGIAPGGRLLMPEPSAPRSMLHVAPPARSARRPAPARAAPNRQAAKPAPATPARPTRPPVPPRAQAVAPPPPRIPAPPVTASAALPPPAAVPKAPPAPLAPQASTRLAAPPPPPPPPVAPTTRRRSSPSASAPMPPPPAAPQKTASIKAPPPPPTSATAPAPGQPLKVLFSGESAKLGDQWHAPLQSLAATLKSNRENRLQLLAYAGGAKLSASRARRLSLSRALAVRSYLIENGVRSTRIDVRALGDKAKDEPKNRVDITVVGR